MGTNFVIPQDWQQWDIDAFERGLSNGWDSANHAEAYGRGGPGEDFETFEQEGYRRGQNLHLRHDERVAWMVGWLLGGVRFGQGQHPDGATVGAEMETMEDGQPGLSKL